MVGETPLAWEPLALWDATPFSHTVDDPLSTAVDAPFPVSTLLNAKLSLWRGPLYHLRVDAVVNSTCESMRESDGDFGKLLKAAGPEIGVECDAAGSCRTGDAVLTRGCQLPAKFILHTVGPRYLPKYHNAAEHALHSCYRSVLTVARENGLRSVAIGCIYTQRKGYPREEAAHVAARTVRRYLEHYSKHFDRIILCVDSVQDMYVYERVLPLYFPRTMEELQKSQQLLETRNLGNSFGEPIIEERKIRIGNLSNSDRHSNQFEFDHCENTGKRQESCALSDTSTGPEAEEAESDILAFRTMLVDPDAERLGRLQQMQEERQRRAAEAAIEEQKRLERVTASTAEWDYVAALQLAKKEDFSGLKALGFCYCGGVDLAGLPVVVYLAGKLRVEELDMERVLLFVLFTLDSQRTALNATCSQFSLLYVHSDVANDNQPPNAWLKRLFRVFAAVAAHRAPSDQPLRNKTGESVLRFFYVLEPSFGFKLQLLMSKGYCDGGGFYNHVVYLQSSEMLNDIAPTLQLPPHIFSYV
ncbi:Protein GDAP2 [Phytophthora citrophthora]|uniref:Protein GDAP2 n=1 Tax=Phytophthora citrophthora TaxID=4793 RepID=A0AAD9LDU0_9STRA|nr:Protein GDAP2 [Phytophthora citrophthora]